MEQNRLRELEEQCIQDCPPPCTSLCPLHVDARQLASAVGQNDFSAGLKIFRKAVPFPGIIARTCDQPCREKCFRAAKGGAIQVAALERACVEFGSIEPGRVSPLPKKSARVAVIGGGLSGLTTARDLARKGYRVTLFEKEARLGGRLWDFSEEILPPDLIESEVAQPAEFGVDVRLNQTMELNTLPPGEYGAVYLGTGLESEDAGTVDPRTFQAGREDVFAGGSLLHEDYSSVRSISEGRRAAISIDRYLQKVSLKAARDNEGAYESCLRTDISAAEPQAPLPVPLPGGYSSSQAAAEARRCLQCECMECVKACEYLRHYGSYPKKYVREIYNNLSIIMRARTANKFINSCTLCGLCGEVCPTDLDMGAVIREVRRTMVKSGKMPVSAHDFALRDMAFSNSEKCAGVFLPDGRRTCTHLLFPGCQLAASNPEYISRLYQDLAPVFPSLGVMLRCCGAPADWSGEEQIFSASLEALKTEWQAAGEPELMLACSSCHQVFKRYLPQARLISVWEVLTGRGILPAKVNSTRPYVIHDPCTSRHESAWQDSARAVLDAMGVAYHELTMSRNLTECCGYGGAAWLANPELTRDIIQRRIKEDEADYLTYCVMCRDLFAREGKPALHLLDLVYGGDPEKLALRRGPDYSQRHENRMRARQQLGKIMTGKDGIKMESHEKIDLILDPEMRSRLEDRLILIEDIQKVIDHALASGESFFNRDTGHSLAFFKPNLITYWVEYSKTGEAFEIHDAYSHRMEFDRAGVK